MLDIKFITTKNIKIIENELSKRGTKVDIASLLSLDEERRKLIIKIEKLKEEQNKGSKKITEPNEKTIKEMKKIKEEIIMINLRDRRMLFSFLIFFLRP